MEQKKIILCDTDVMIEFYRNNPKVVEQLVNIGQDRLAVSIITCGELIYGAFNKRELHQIKRDLNSLIQIDIEALICKRFLKIMDLYALSH